MARTMNQVIRDVTLEYLNKIDINDVNNIPSPAQIEAEILEKLASIFEQENCTRQPGNRWRIMQKLNFTQIADIMAHLYQIVCVKTAGPSASSDFDLLAVYQTDGPDKGIYVTDTEVFRRIAKQYNYTLTRQEFEECMVALRDLVPHKEPCHDRDLIAVNNGIFDYELKQLMPFDPSFIFLKKSRVNYDPNATNVVIHNDEDGTDWDVESWMDELTDDPEITHVLWQILGAIIRPNVPWGKAAWFYSETGNNGKGTLCELMRQLCGRGSYASVSLSDFSKEFMLEPLIRATSIIVDENDVGTYIDKAANLKAVITGDTIFINRKFKMPIAYQFKGFMIQCLNEMPRIKDKSDSFFRRQLFIPFTKCFTGKERKYIKHDYLHRAEVLEYVLYRVLHMDYYELDTPAACVDALEEYKSYVDPIREFLEEVMPKVKWDLLPFSFLYDLYVSWYKQTHNGDKNIKSLRGFTMDVRKLIESNYSAWACTDSGAGMRPSSRMDDAEPLIATYGLTNWMNPLYMTDRDLDRKCHPLTLAVRYRGIYRLVIQQGSDEDLEFANSTDNEEISDEM